MSLPPDGINKMLTILILLTMLNFPVQKHETPNSLAWSQGLA